MQAWTVLSDAEKQVIRKLCGPGAKLISGPRGSGKSTLLRLAYFELLRSKAALPVYVNFSKALALEPLFHTHADALKWFRLWVLSKIVDGVGDTFATGTHAIPVHATTLLGQCRSYINSLETGKPPDSDALELSDS